MDRKYLFGIDDGGRTAGMISYFFVFGWSLGYFGFHVPNKNTLSAYHLRQTLFMYLAFMMIWFGLSLFPAAILPATGLLSALNLKIVVAMAFVGLWFTGFNAASKAEEKPIPVLGSVAQHVFSFIREEH